MTLTGKLRIATQNVKKTYNALRPRPIVQHKLRLIYYPIPKAASSSVCSWLIQNSNMPAKAKVLPAPYVSSLLERNRISTRASRKLVGYKSFAVIRNPYARIWSLYRDKIVRHKKEGWQLRYGFSRYNILWGKELFSYDMTFDEFVSAVCSIPETIADEHFRSQYRLLPSKSDHIRVDFIIHFEKLNHEMNLMCGQVGLPDFDVNINRSQSTDLAIEMSQQSIALLKARYKRDFGLLNYASDI